MVCNKGAAAFQTACSRDKLGTKPCVVFGKVTPCQNNGLAARQPGPERWPSPLAKYPQDTMPQSNPMDSIRLADVVQKCGAKEVCIVIPSRSETVVYTQVVRSVERGQARDQLPLLIIIEQCPNTMIDLRGMAMRDRRVKLFST
jgi:hypothetical protein